MVDSVASGNPHGSAQAGERLCGTHSFGNALTEDESNALYERWVVPAPGRPLFEAATANLHRDPDRGHTDNPAAARLLLIMGGQDHTCPKPSHGRP